MLHIRPSLNPDRGRGVYTSIDLHDNQTFEVCPLIRLEMEEVGPTLRNYVFDFEVEGEVVIALGFGSLYNHSYHPNAYYYYQECDDDIGYTLNFCTLRTIKAGEEILVNYNGDYESKEELWFPVKD